MEPIHLIVNGLSLALIVVTILWWRLYRRLGPAPPRRGRAYRLRQLLIVLIATLTIVVALLIVFASDPGNPDDYLSGP